MVYHPNLALRNVRLKSAFNQEDYVGEKGRRYSCVVFGSVIAMITSKL